MGQYHQFMNFDKKEVYFPKFLRKLTEWSYQSNDYMLEVEELLKTSWKGDRVFVVGDYVSDFYDNCEHSDILLQIRDENPNYSNRSIYDYPYKEVEVNTNHKIPYRYIYNHSLKQYLDLKQQPIQRFNYDKNKNILYGAKYHPLPLLLSCSNGAGGGDYYYKNDKYVGKWVTNYSDIELSDKKLDLDYHELYLLFDETKSDKLNAERIIDYLSNTFKNDVDVISDLKFDKALFLDNDEIEFIKNQAKENISKNIEKEIDEIERDM